MVTAKRLINENLKLVDMVIELLDARIPSSSTNPEFQKLFQNKIRVIVLNKEDFADSSKTDEWVNHFKSQDITAIPINALNKNDMTRAKKIIFDLAKKKQQEIKERKGINKTIRAMVIGVPNVGKSTFINSFTGKAKAKTGDRPGITKNKQWVKVSPFFELLDTPGLLWPRLDNEKIGLHLAYTGSIREEILNLEEVVHYFLEEMSELYPELLINRYKLQHLDKKGYELLEEISIKRGWVQSGGVPDTERGSRQILNEYQTGKIGRTTLERPGEDEIEDA